MENFFLVYISLISPRMYTLVVGGEIMELFDLIKKEILEGELVPGQKLKEEELATKYNTSRTPIREAIQKLSAEGLVQYTKNKGTYVRKYSLEDITNTYDLRSVIEGYAAFLAAQHATNEDLLKLEKSIQDFEQLTKLYQREEKNPVILDLIENNIEFHTLITEASGNKEIPKVLKSLSSLPIMYKGYHWFNYIGVLKSLEHHKLIFNAIKKRDSLYARSLMEIHLIHGKENILSHVECL
ncbi:GntR family transcriptional regulator OS=Ureibacillus acetophenoni OX=614649 GN=SAMN05877842_11766 PE=4 SV=1 [Ureibacillus acetophenoni]